MERWANKIALVTGASVGIGASICEKLVEAGLQVVGLARRPERVQELANKLSGKPGKLHALKSDITVEQDILNAFKWTTENVGPVNILVNNAGVFDVTELIDGDIKKWRNMFDTNVLGLCIATSEAIKIMQKHNIDGHIVHINSIAGHKIPNAPAHSMYPASKYAVTALTETLRQDLIRIGSKIKVTSVSPGVVRTNMPTNYFTEQGTTEMLETVPMLDPVDVANAVMYTLSTPPHVQVHELIIKPIGEQF